MSDTCVCPDTSVKKGLSKGVRGPDLFWGPSGGGVSNGPGRLLPGPELRLLQDVDEHREDVGVDHSLWESAMRREKTTTITSAVDPWLQFHTWDPIKRGHQTPTCSQAWWIELNVACS